MELKDIQQRIRDINIANGWREDTPHTPDTFRDIARLALITTEVSEAIEEIRNGHAPDATYHTGNGKPEGVPSELADVLIRTLDLADEFGIDLEKIVLEKLDYNASRGHMHGGKTA